MSDRPICEQCNNNPAAKCSTIKSGYRKLCTPCHRKKYKMRPNGGNKWHRSEAYKNKINLIPCCLCNFQAIHTIQLDVDHIDENHKNNNESNLRVICGNCHILKSIMKRYENPIYKQRPLCVICDKNLAMKNKNGIGFRSNCYPCEVIKYKILSAGRKYHTGEIYDQKVSLFPCITCGFKALHTCQLDIDHIDENHENNDQSNLQLLCRNCHKLKTQVVRNNFVIPLTPTLTH